MIRAGIVSVILWMAEKLVDFADWLDPIPEINEANLEALDAYVNACADYDAARHDHHNTR